MTRPKIQKYIVRSRLFTTQLRSFATKDDAGKDSGSLKGSIRGLIVWAPKNVIPPQ